MGVATPEHGGTRYHTAAMADVRVTMKDQTPYVLMNALHASQANMGSLQSVC
eukprot:COSAG06_NODE_340_length_17187_cov_578.135475_13_plen_52_part_00